jgi:hypothetical protein
LEGTRAGLSALWAAESRLQSGGVETEDVGEKGGKGEDVVLGNRGRICSSIGAFRWSHGAGGGYGEGVEKD